MFTNSTPKRAKPRTMSISTMREAGATGPGSSDAEPAVDKEAALKIEIGKLLPFPFVLPIQAGATVEVRRIRYLEFEDRGSQIMPPPGRSKISKLQLFMSLPSLHLDHVDTELAPTTVKHKPRSVDPRYQPLHPPGITLVVEESRP